MLNSSLRLTKTSFQIRLSLINSKFSKDKFIKKIVLCEGHCQRFYFPKLQEQRFFLVF